MTEKEEDALKSLREQVHSLRQQVKHLSLLLPAVKQVIRAITISEANKASRNLCFVLMKVEPNYFISMDEWLAKFDAPETD